MVTGADGAVCQVIGGVGLERGESLGSGGELGVLWEQVLGHVQHSQWQREGRGMWRSLDDVDFKELASEKVELYSRKIRCK